MYVSCINKLMKHSIFKIRNIGLNQRTHNKAQDQQETPNDPNHQEISNQKIDQLLLQMRKMIDRSINSEARDRHISVQGGKLSQGKFNNDEIQAWIGKVCRDIMSSAYQLYLSNEMNYNQTKIYCCQQILSNISQFVERNSKQITPQFYEILDNTLKIKIFPYLKLKYPPSVSKQVNKKLNRIFKQVNNMEVITYDFFYNSDISLQYQKNGIYNKFIMEVLNQIIKVTDLNVSDDKDADPKTNFQDFQEFMSELFENVYDQEWMIKGKMQKGAKINDQQQKQRYKEQVKDYTHYLIGKKIPQHVQQFEQFEIKSGLINIKSPTILRIITKWCQQLWEKFDNENYYIDRTQGITMLKGKQVNIVYPWLKASLKNRMKKEKQKIIQYMKNIQLNNYEQQFQIMKNQQQSNQAVFLDKYERICGKFSLKIVKNLENYIVIYLNRLIHGLMTISKQLYEQQMKDKPSWMYPPNLLSFKVGDLLRCKCSSKERQIIRIFDQIKQISEKNPQKLKIIRIKNRLSLGTNDILINVRFNNSITAEIQLKVDSKFSQSRFSYCSYNFSHLIYQLQRSYFGSITQMCSIWANLDPRIQFYNKLINEEKSKGEKMLEKDSQCLKNSKDHQLSVASSIPFICSQCKKAYSNNNYVVPHYKCTKCKYWKCAICTIKQSQASNLIDLVIQQEQIRNHCKRTRCQELPTYSVGTLLQSKQKELSYFKVLQVFQKTYVFRIKDQSQQLFKQLNTSKQVKQFLKDYIIFQLEQSYTKKIIEIQKRKLINEQILPAYGKKCYKFDKQTISLNDLDKYDAKPYLSNILEGSKQQKKCIKFIQLSDNEIDKVQFLSHDFKNLQFLNMNINNIKGVKHLAGFTKLQTLFLATNKISEFPKELCDLKLKYLSLFDNKIQNLPSEFGRLKSLQNLRLNKNLLTSFPQTFGELSNLKELEANNNEIVNIDSLTCTKLEYLDLSVNQLTKLSQTIEALSNLHYFNVRINRIEGIEVQFGKLKKLKQFIIAENLINKMPEKIQHAPQLTTLDISLQKTFILDLSKQYLALKDVNFEKEEIEQIKGIECLKNVQSLKLGDNSIKKLPQDIWKLSHLKYLSLSRNNLTELPPKFGQLSKLKTLLLSQNKLDRFPLSFFSLKLETLNFNFNKVHSIPQELSTMKSLIKLQFEGNSVQKLPNNIGTLYNLQILNVTTNKFQQLPSYISTLKKLKQLMFRGITIFNLSQHLIKFQNNFQNFNRWIDQKVNQTYGYGQIVDFTSYF